MGIAEDFPKRYEPRAVETKRQAEWYSKKIYAFREQDSRETFSIDTPPPTVSGRLHIGHVFSYTHTEIISRFRRMQGYNVLYPFGYDDNGLPTEILTEKDLGIRAYQMDREKFRELCLETGKKYSKLFSDLWKAMGFSCDFDSAYSTISKESQKISQWSFVDLHKKGNLDRRNEPALWCTNCVTSFSQAEIEDENRAGQYVHIPFVVEGLAPLLVATTRPELLSACVSVFVHPDDDRYKKYIGKTAKVPFYEHSVPIIGDDKAQIDKGTGVVMCCTFGDSTDILWWRQYKLPLREALSKIGKMTEISGPLAGLKVEAAKAKMIEVLKEKNLVLKIVDIPVETRVVNTHERCGTPVEYLVQPQWFIKVCDIKDELIAYGKKVKWNPDFMRHRYENWVQNLSWDWAISRQRSFGVPIPAWYSADGKHIHIAKPEELPIDPTATKPSTPCPDGGEWIPDADVLDTWATSSITPLINAHWTMPNQRKNFLPMSMRPQAHDIIRTWAFGTIVKSYYHFNDVPWKEIVISGHVKKPGAKVEASQVAGQAFAKKTKISKSKDGDTYAPEKIMERHPADAIRLWSASASLGTDVIFDENGISDAEKFLNKLWNASRFALLNFDEAFRPQKDFVSSYPVDRWILARLGLVWKNFEKNFVEYETHSAKVDLDKFFWIDFCDNYIEFVKWRCFGSDTAKKNEATQTLYQVLFSLLQMYAPFAPHITDEIYHLFFKKFEGADSLHLTQFTKIPAVPDSEASLQIGKNLAGTIGLIRAFKSKNQLSFKTPLQKIYLSSTPAHKPGLEKVFSDIQAFSSAQSIEFTEQTKEWFETAFEEIRIAIEVDWKAVEDAKKSASPS